MNFFKTDDSTVFIENLYRLHSHDIYNIAFHYCKNKADAEDCLQEVFFRALSNVKMLKSHPYPNKWLFVTVRLVSLEKLRINRKKSQRELNINDFESSLQSESFEDVLFEQSYSEQELILLRDDILRRLNDKEHKLYILRYVNKLSVDEISNHLKISYSNTTTRLNRLKKKIIAYVKNIL